MDELIENNPELRNVQITRSQSGLNYLIGGQRVRLKMEDDVIIVSKESDGNDAQYVDIKSYLQNHLASKHR